MSDIQVVDPYRSIYKRANVPAPLTIVLNSTNGAEGYMQGVPPSHGKPEVYVCISALPDELRNRVVLAVQTLKSGL